MKLEIENFSTEEKINALLNLLFKRSIIDRFEYSYLLNQEQRKGKNGKNGNN